MGKISDRLSRPDRQLGYLGAGSRRVLGKRVLPLLRQVRDIYERNNYNGALYLPKNIAALNQLSTGTTPVTAVTDPIGFQADERLGLALGPELVISANIATAVGYDNVTTVVGTSFSTVGATSGVRVAATITTVIGKSYWVSFQRGAFTLAPTCFATDTAGGAGSVLATGSTTNTALFFTATSTQSSILFANSNPLATYSISSLSVRLLDGNHSIQATAAARPTWQVDANGKYYISLLGTDDCFTSATGGGGSAGFFWCGAIQPTGGAGTYRTLWDDRGANTGYVAVIDLNNKLSLIAGNGAAYTTLVSPATVDVGTKYLLTVWDDGTNLNVQINAATAESVARPVVAAGSAGFTRFKANTAAVQYFIGYEYASAYFKNTGLTARERLIVQQLVSEAAGL